MSESSLPDVLVVSDQRRGSRYGDWLEPGYAVTVDTPSTGVDLPVEASVVVLDWGVPAELRERLLDDAAGVGGAAVVAICEGVPRSDPIEAGADDYLLVPVGQGKLRAAVERAHLRSVYRQWLQAYLDATAEVESDEAVPPDLPDEVTEAVTGMDRTLDELVAELDYSQLFRSLFEESADDRE